MRDGDDPEANTKIALKGKVEEEEMSGQLSTQDGNIIQLIRWFF